MINKKQLLEFICTWFYSGKAPKAPGTFGSLATLPFVYLVSSCWHIPGIIAFSAAVFIIGVWAADAYVKMLNLKDPGFIVIDETAGQALALLFAGTNIYLYLLGFALFRLFDILKPWPVSWADKKVPGGLGIMLDDVFAGRMAAAVMKALLLI